MPQALATAWISWRTALRQEIHSLAFRFRDELDTPHYGPRAGTWVREAGEATDEVIKHLGHVLRPGDGGADMVIKGTVPVLTAR